GPDDDRGLRRLVRAQARVALGDRGQLVERRRQPLPDLAHQVVPLDRLHRRQHRPYDRPPLADHPVQLGHELPDQRVPLVPGKVRALPLGAEPGEEGGEGLDDRLHQQVALGPEVAEQHRGRHPGAVRDLTVGRGVVALLREQLRARDEQDPAQLGGPAARTPCGRDGHTVPARPWTVSAARASISASGVGGPAGTGKSTSSRAATATTMATTTRAVSSGSGLTSANPARTSRRRPRAAASAGSSSAPEASAASSARTTLRLPARTVWRSARNDRRARAGSASGPAGSSRRARTSSASDSVNGSITASTISSFLVPKWRSSTESDAPASAAMSR